MCFYVQAIFQRGILSTKYIYVIQVIPANPLVIWKACLQPNTIYKCRSGVNTFILDDKVYK